eukprot:CAMPEP_0184485810 /NCGR_PEP_ID=MMETSP0113_2-20130426/7406_1 /TAXON_ID=91329 /ORGANISM="Norrisiella sphaerica, Strain BC52" /LENGTH=557 /DNA_ID=CAMNT_0026867447 /DNA_START=299 /DNA_END=1972 /DNA_ORIENTATION=-
MKLLLLLALSLATVFSQLTQCNIQMVIIVDESGSINDNQFQAELDFAADLILDTFNGVDVREFATFTYDTVPRLQFQDQGFNFTSDGIQYAQMVRGISRTGNGNTFTGRALEVALQLFNDPLLADDVPRTVVLLSDGVTTEEDRQNALINSDLLKDTGVIIFSIFIGNNDEGIDLARQYASSPADTFAIAINDINDLGQIAQQIADQSCVNATSISEVCGVSDAVINVNGSNLAGDDLLRCRFTFDNGEQFVVNADPIDESAIRCRAQSINRTGNATIEVSRDGRTFAGSDALRFLFLNQTSDCFDPTALSDVCGAVPDTNIIVSGTNLLVNVDPAALLCRFTFDDGEEIIVDAELIDIDDFSLQCITDNINRTGVALIDVSLDGGTFSGRENGLFFQIVQTPSECFGPRPDVRVPFALYGIIFPALLLLSLGALLDYKSSLTKAAASPSPKAAAANNAVAAAAPPIAKKKWKEVNATGYLWARSGGGTAPMKVNWNGIAPPMAPRGQEGFGKEKVLVWDFDTTFDEGRGAEGVKEDDKSFLDSLVEKCCCCCSKAK